MKLNIGCGKSVIEGFHGVDSIDFGQKYVLDVRGGLYLWASSSIDEVYSSHFIEHLTMPHRINLFNELHLIMKPGAIATIVTPDFSSPCAYGDPTHVWPPVSEWFYYYLNKEWREKYAPHILCNCDFEYHTEIQVTRIEHFELVNLVATLTCIK